MIARLEHAIVQAFLAAGNDSHPARAAANQAMLRLLHAPVFGGAYANHYLFTDHAGYEQLTFLRQSKPTSADPLRQIMDQDGSICAPMPQRAGAILDCSSLIRAAAAIEPLVDLILQSHASIRTPAAIDLFDDQAMRDFSIGMVGPCGDLSLSRFGIKYHQPSWNDPPMRYLVAHTNLEVAGILGISQCQHGQKGLCVRYVSVNPGFQRQGLACAMYRRFIDLAMDEGCYIVRSSAGHDTPPRATARFDAMLAQAGCPHATTGTYMDAALAIVMAANPSTHALARIASACTRATQALRQGGDNHIRVDYEQAMQLRAMAPASRRGPSR